MQTKTYHNHRRKMPVQKRYDEIPQTVRSVRSPFYYTDKHAVLLLTVLQILDTVSSFLRNPDLNRSMVSACTIHRVLSDCSNTVSKKPAVPTDAQTDQMPAPRHRRLFFLQNYRNAPESLIRSGYSYRYQGLIHRQSVRILHILKHMPAVRGRIRPLPHFPRALHIEKYISSSKQLFR